MIAIELGVICAALLSVLQVFLGDEVSALTNTFLASATALAIVHVIVSHFRWQLLPAYLVLVAILLVQAVSPNSSGVAVYIGMFVAIVLLLISLLLALGIPVRPLPAPNGPLAVGTISVNKEYEVESAVIEDDITTRKLFVKVWYPANTKNASASYKRETLWSEFYQSNNFPGFVSVFSRFLKNIKTHSLEGAPILTDEKPYPLIIYNHGLISISAENTLLMESLASNGYIVVSIRHTEQMSEFASIQKGISPEEKSKDKEIFKQLGESMSREARSALSLRLYQQSTGMPQVVTRRVADAKHVLDNITSILALLPGDSSENCADLERTGVMGLSLGGAVATELCQTDDRCSAAVNMDGGIYGDHILEPLNVPYLMLYSEKNVSCVDFLKEATTADFHESTISESTHLNYHDAAVVLPILKWMGVLGKISGTKMVEQKNDLVKRFFDKYL